MFCRCTALCCAWLQVSWGHKAVNRRHTSGPNQSALQESGDSHISLQTCSSHLQMPNVNAENVNDCILRLVPLDLQRFHC